MARALFGHLGSQNDPALLAEIARLRRRVADLEEELAELRAHARGIDDSSLDLELHRLTGDNQPALA